MITDQIIRFNYNFVIALLPLIALVFLISKNLKNKNLLYAFSLSYVIFLSNIVLIANISSLFNISLKFLYKLYWLIFILVLLLVAILNINNINIKLISFDILKKFKYMFILFTIIITSLISWQSAFTTHPADEGIHVFWSKYAYYIDRIPDYEIVEPLEQSTKFVYGTHVLLAYFYVFNIDPFYDIKVFEWLISLVSLFLFYTIVFSLTKNHFISTIAIISYIFHFLSGGYIQRGNIPDIIGMSILLSVVAVIIQNNVNIKNIFLLVLLGISTLIVYHPYHLITLLSTLTIFYILYTKDLINILKIITNKKTLTCFIYSLTIILTSYNNLYYLKKGTEEVTKIKWNLFVPSFEHFTLSIGLYFISALSFSITILLLFIMFRFQRTYIDIININMNILINRKTNYYLNIKILNFKKLLFISSWFLSTILLTQLPKIGIGIEPVRFLWRSLEPSIILAGVIFYVVYKTLISNKKVKFKHIYNTILLLIIALGLFIPSFFVKPNVLEPERYKVDEKYFELNKELGLFLKNYIKNINISINDIALITNADIDKTATYLQVYSFIPKVLYKTDYAINIAPYPYNKTLAILKYIYESNLDDYNVYRMLYDIKKAYNVKQLFLVYYDKEKYIWTVNKHIYEPIIIYERNNTWILLLKINDVNQHVNITYDGWFLHYELFNLSKDKYYLNNVIIARSVEIKINNNANISKIILKIYPMIVKDKDGKLLSDKTSVDIYKDGKLIYTLVFNLTSSELIGNITDFRIHWPELSAFIGRQKQLIIDINQHESTTIKIETRSPLSFIMLVEDFSYLKSFIFKKSE